MAVIASKPVQTTESCEWFAKETVEDLKLYQQVASMYGTRLHILQKEADFPFNIHILKEENCKFEDSLIGKMSNNGEAGFCSPKTLYVVKVGLEHEGKPAVKAAYQYDGSIAGECILTDKDSRLVEVVIIKAL